MLRRVALVITDVTGGNFSIRVTVIGELRTTLAVTSNRRTPRRNIKYLFPSSSILVILMKEALRSSEMSDLTIATRCNIPENAILHIHRRENLKSLIALTGWNL
jgi:hypothetical protein